MTTLHAANSTRWLSFFNASGETIPSYGVFSLITDTELPESESDNKKLIGAKYNPSPCKKVPSGETDLYPARYERIFAINSRVPVEAGRWGMCTLAIDGPAWARWRPEQDTTIQQDGFADAESESLSSPHIVGPYPGSFGLSRFGFGFEVVRVPQTADGRILVRQVSPFSTIEVVIESQWLSAAVPDRLNQSVGPPFNWGYGYVSGQSGRSGTAPQDDDLVHKASVAVIFQQFPACCLGNGGTIQAKYQNGQFHAVGGGIEFIRGAIVTQGSAVTGAPAIANLAYRSRGGSDSGEYRVSNYVAYVSPADNSLSLPYHAIVDVLYTPGDPQNGFTAINVHCPLTSV